MIVAVGALGAGIRAIVDGWRSSVRETQEVVADAGPARQYHRSTPSNDADLDHARFTLDQLMTPGQPTDRKPPAPGDLPAVELEGDWTASTGTSNVVGDFYRNGCPYAIKSLSLNLRETDGRIFGFGEYTLSTIRCETGPTDVTAYAAVTGVVNPPYVKLTIRDGETGKKEFAFFGTSRPEGILGQVRSTSGDLLLEHVSLGRP